jgi:4-hydroxybenzoate polyprenyltransferase
MSKLRAYCELARLPNVFTAMADILAGYWLAAEQFRWSAALGWLLLASACLYSAGIVFNDLHDIEIDRQERPARPLPSGRISVRSAWRVVFVLILAGLAAATLAGLQGSPLLPRTSLVALALIAAIVAYDFGLKATWLGPINMGACRALNFLMAVTACDLSGVDSRRHVMIITAGILIYIASITYFGHNEAGVSGRGRLIAGGFGIGVAIWMVGSVSIVRSGYPDFTMVLWLILAIHLARVTIRAIRNPSSSMVKYAMKTFVMSIIVVDAIIASAAGGWQAGVIVLALLAPALVLGRWIYST